MAVPARFRVEKESSATLTWTSTVSSDSEALGSGSVNHGITNCLLTGIMHRCPATQGSRHEYLAKVALRNHSTHHRFRSETEPRDKTGEPPAGKPQTKLQIWIIE